jgi:hypothetical protein
VALSEYVLETMEPAEIEAEVARRWSLPIRRLPDLRLSLVMFASLVAGTVVSLLVLAVLAIPLGALQLLLRIHMATLSARLSLGFGVVFAVFAARYINRWMSRRADRSAAQLVGSDEAVTRAAGKMAAMLTAPWEWSKAVEAPVTPAAGPGESLPGTTRVFSSAWRSRIGSLKANGMLAALSLPPLAVAMAVRSGVFPAAARWPAYLSGMALALLLRYAISKVLDFWSYRRLRDKLAERMRVTHRDGTMFVGLSPEPRPLVYDGAWDWDVGFLTLSEDRLDYRGEQARFTLRREQVTEVRLDKGSPHWSDPHWVYVSWRDDESGREGTFPLIVPRTNSPWGLSRQVRELHRKLVGWKSGNSGRAAVPPAESGLPVFSGAGGSPPPRQLPQMAAMIVVGGVCPSLLAHFPIGGEASLYFALVWTANVLWDLFGHRFAASPETAAA